MYDPIFAKSFSKYERRRFGFCAFFVSLIVALSICLIFKPRLHPLSALGDAVSLQLSIDAIQTKLNSQNTSEQSVGNVANLQVMTNNVARDIIVVNDTSENSRPLANNAAKSQLSIVNPCLDSVVVNDTSENSRPMESHLPIVNPSRDSFLVNDTSENSRPIANNAMNSQFSIVNPTLNKLIVNNTIENLQPKIEPLCRILEPMADYCEIEGDVRIYANSSTVFLVARHPTISNQASSWHVKPYARKANIAAMTYVKNWTVTLAENKDYNIPICTKNHTSPAILFSVGGFTGNHFHDFSDLVIPLYSTSLKFDRDVHFLTTDTKPWWVGKFRGLLNKLTRHEIIDIDKEKQVHCYTKVVVGLKPHKELIIDSSKSQNSGVSMQNFRQFLRQTYSLERTKAIKLKKGDERKPRLMIISRKRTRLLTNVDEIAQLARKMGFEIVVDEADHSTDISRFAQVVNSCDVLMGVHGAGLTNMVFLPENAVLIQIIPLGAIDGFARTDFGEPSDGMKIKYLEYKIKVRESSLSEQYPLDHPVFRDPKSFHIKGWLILRKTYLDQQNVTVDLRRFKGTLAKAMKILHH